MEMEISFLKRPYLSDNEEISEILIEHFFLHWKIYVSFTDSIIIIGTSRNFRRERVKREIASAAKAKFWKNGIIKPWKKHFSEVRFQILFT